MKLIRFGASEQEKPGVHINGKNYDVSAFIYDYDESFFKADGLQQLSVLVQKGNLPEIPLDVRIGSPIARPSKIVCKAR